MKKTSMLLVLGVIFAIVSAYIGLQYSIAVENKSLMPMAFIFGELSPFQVGLFVFVMGLVNAGLIMGIIASLSQSMSSAIVGIFVAVVEYGIFIYAYLQVLATGESIPWWYALTGAFFWQLAVTFVVMIAIVIFVGILGYPAKSSH